MAGQLLRGQRGKNSLPQAGSIIRYFVDCELLTEIAAGWTCPMTSSELALDCDLLGDIKLTIFPLTIFSMNRFQQAGDPTTAGLSEFQAFKTGAASVARNRSRILISVSQNCRLGRLPWPGFPAVRPNL